MKKYIIILLALPLIASSCLKDDDDKFDKSASERMKEYLDNTDKVLSSAENGWLVEYYPSATQQYGGVRMYLKFNAEKGEVTVASEAGGPDKTETSLYSYGEDYGPTINFDSYNSLFHYYSEPAGTVGEENIGWGGDYEFIIMSVESDKVVLRGKKSKNTIVLTPASTADWKADFTSYVAAAQKMDGMLSYQIELGSRVYTVSRDVVDTYDSRHFTINCTPAITAGFIYTQTGLKFYEPITVDNVTISEMTWQDGKFVDEKTGVTISEIKSDHTLQITKSGIQNNWAYATVTPDDPQMQYVIGAYPAEWAATMTDEQILRAMMPGVTADNLFTGAVDGAKIVLRSESSYIACAFSVVVVNDYIYPTSSLFKTESFETGAISDNFRYWLGQWTVTSTSSEIQGKPVTLDVKIMENLANQTYSIYGWDISILRNRFAQPAKLSGQNLTVAGDNDLGTWQDYTVWWFAMSYIEGREGSTIVTGIPEAMTLTPNGDTPRVKMYSGQVEGGLGFEVWSMSILLEADDGGLYVANADHGYTAQDFPIGPYTMVRKAGGIPLEAVVAVNPNTANKAPAYKSYIVNMNAYTHGAPKAAVAR